MSAQEHLHWPTRSTAQTFRDIIGLVEAGRIDTKPWITHRFELAETPQIFPGKIGGNPAVLKAMIEVAG